MACLELIHGMKPGMPAPMMDPILLSPILHASVGGDFGMAAPASLTSLGLGQTVDVSLLR